MSIKNNDVGYVTTGETTKRKIHESRNSMETHTGVALDDRKESGSFVLG
jgi:hypothetical protein